MQANIDACGVAFADGVVQLQNALTSATTAYTDAQTEAGAAAIALTTATAAYQPF